MISRRASRATQPRGCLVASSPIDWIVTDIQFEASNGIGARGWPSELVKKAVRLAEVATQVTPTIADAA